MNDNLGNSFLAKLIRYFFPRKEWKIIQVINVYGHYDDMPVRKEFILQDQFGNIKKKKV